MASHVPSFLKPIPKSEQQSLTPIFDSTLRRDLFHHAEAGNEQSITERRASAVSTDSHHKSTDKRWNAGVEHQSYLAGLLH